MNTKRIITSLTALALIQIFAMAPASHASRWRTCNGDNVTWRNPNVWYQPTTISFPPGSAQRAALERARISWSYFLPGGVFRAYFNYAPSYTWYNGNGVSEITFTNDFNWGTSLYGYTLIRYEPCFWPFYEGRITEADILLNPSVYWDMSPNPTPASVNYRPSLALLAAHELGHSLGLDHEYAAVATMNPNHPFGGTLGNFNDPDPHADDTLGARYLYGTYGVRRDVAASVFRRSGAGSSEVIPRPFSAPRGGTVSFDYTISNRGTNHEPYVRVNFYLSTDRYINTADTYIGAAAFWMNPGYEGTWTRSVTIPTWITPGYYYIGVMLDPYGAIPEVDEDNNGVALHSYTYIY